MNVTNEMHFPLDNSVCRVETTCPLVRLDNLVAFLSKLMKYFSTCVMSTVLDMTTLS